MKLFERVAVKLRRSKQLRDNKLLWDMVRPKYRRVLSLLGRQGLERAINGSGRIRIAASLYNLPEDYEPDVWHHLMRELRIGDSFADVGASIGIMALTGAQRIGQSGCVWAFEPDSLSCAHLRTNVALNRLGNCIRVVDAVVSSSDGTMQFLGGRATESRVAQPAEIGQIRTVRSVSLDTFFATKRLDVLKIDVEGHELSVLRGALRLLRAPQRAPRYVLIEAHPFAWRDPQEGESIVSLLTDCGYFLTDLSDQPVRAIQSYGHIVARRVPIGSPRV